jgi:hypothetical protein
MKIFSLHILFNIFLIANSFGQSITEIFKVLPLEYTPELTLTGKDSLIIFGEYFFPDADSIETMKCDLVIDAKEDIQINYSFTTGQSGFIVVELKKFVKQNGEVIVVVSRYSGTRRVYEQDFLKAFNLINNKLYESKMIQLPSHVELKDFIKPNTPDSLIEKIKNNISMGYNLNSENGEGVEYTAYLQDDSFDEWLSTTSIIFTWNGNSFRKNNNR